MCVTKRTKCITWNLESVPGSLPVESSVTWTSDNPLEILVAFNAGLDSPVEWTFARDLLLDALQNNQAGEADVQCEVKDDTLLLKIASPFGSARFTTVASVVGQFLAEIYSIVPRGREDYGDATDMAIFQILDGMEDT